MNINEIKLIIHLIILGYRRVLKTNTNTGIKITEILNIYILT